MWFQLKNKNASVPVTGSTADSLIDSEKTISCENLKCQSKYWNESYSVYVNIGSTS